jgi:hypothetical protein
MRLGLRRRGRLAAVFLAAGSLCLATAASVLPHTHDASELDTHCVACTWHYGSIGVVPAAVTLVVAPVPVADVVAVRDRAWHDVASVPTSSRGPPLA